MGDTELCVLCVPLVAAEDHDSSHNRDLLDETNTTGLCEVVPHRQVSIPSPVVYKKRRKVLEVGTLLGIQRRYALLDVLCCWIWFIVMVAFPLTLTCADFVDIFCREYILDVFRLSTTVTEVSSYATR